MKTLSITKNACIIFCFILMMPFAQASLITFDPQESNATIDDLIFVDIVMLGLRTSETIGGFDFGIQFDPSKVSLEDIIFASEDNINSLFNGWTNIPLNTSGQAELYDLFWFSDPGVAGQLTLATLTFKALSIGITDLNILFDYGSAVISDGNGFALQGVSMESGRINITAGNVAVHEPSSSFLLLLGLFLFIRKSWAS